MKKRIYSKEFKAQTVQLSYNRENSKELADELGVAVQRIYKWRRVSKDASKPKTSIPVEKQDVEIRRLHLN